MWKFWKYIQYLVKLVKDDDYVAPLVTKWLSRDLVLPFFLLLNWTHWSPKIDGMTKPNEHRYIRYGRIGPKFCESVDQERLRGMPYRWGEEDAARTAIEGAET